jgi:hypothetical protein
MLSVRELDPSKLLLVADISSANGLSAKREVENDNQARLPLENRFQRKVCIEMIGSQPIAIEER